jgi:hypothetical protein
MKKFFIATMVFLCTWAFVTVGRAMMKSPVNVQAAAVAPINTQYATPTFRPTETAIPTSTIGYEATIYVAQATADEARRVNAQATAAHEQHILSIVQLTAAQDARNQEILSWTQIAAPTVIPLTATMQVVINTQVAEGEKRVADMMTATMQAPTQYAAMINAQSNARYADAMRIVDVFGKIAIGLFCTGLAVFLFRWKPPEPKPAAEPQTETVVQIRRDKGNGDFGQTRAVVPCSPEQLSELAEMAVNGEKRFGVNRLETQSRTFRKQRTTVLNVRQFLIDNHLVIADESGHIALNDDGEEFLAAWFDAHKLPDGYNFDDTPPSPTVSDGHEFHEHEANPADSAMGEWQKLNRGDVYTQEGAI